MNCEDPILVECDYCHCFWEITDKDYCVKGETFKGIDIHHNPPQFMMKNWNGELYNLCRKHHRKLHDEIITRMNIKAGTLKFIKSEYYVWLKLSQKQKDELVKEIYEFTKKWVEDGDTKAVTD